MKLLYVTQKLHEQDAFIIQWIQAFMAQGFTVEVICLEKRVDDSALPFTVHSMGKERGYSKLRQVWNFWRLIVRLKYDRVFLHMFPIWGGLAAWWWIPRRVPVYLWYTHYQMQWSLKLLGWYGKRFFCATPQSLPQYEGSPKKVVTGHGIDLAFWPQRENVCTVPTNLLVVHRLSRSKRLELNIKALTHLPTEYRLDIYGIEAEPDYVAELRTLVDELQLHDRVTFHGTTPMETLPGIYVQHRYILNMASETIDKTMLEAMTCGCYPVTTQANAQAIGIPDAPAEDPAAIAAWLETHLQAAPLSAEQMYAVVQERHSLVNIVATMSDFIRQGS